MNKQFGNWIIFIALSIIWGSSFVLMKEGLRFLSAYQVASLRIIASGIVLLPVALRNFHGIPRNKIGYVFLSGLLGSLLPAYLFCVAEEKIESSLAGVLNSLTPIFVLIFGAWLYKIKTSRLKIFGIIISLGGCFLLFFTQSGFAQNSHAFHIFLVVLATICYGINVNMVARHLHHVPSLQIAAMALFLNSIPAFLVLFFTGYFTSDFSHRGILISSGYSILLGVFGTAIASVIFYMLIKRAGAIFSSMTTYAIPVVAIIWGILYGETIGLMQVLGLIIILAGVYLVNKKPATAKAISKP